ncbi:MAG: helix-turn-helix transcriptional regulator [Pseudomonadota bacterium]
MTDTDLPPKNITTDRLDELLAEKGWSPTRLSLAAGLGKGAVNDILADPTRHPRPKTLGQLARVLGVDREYLSGDSDVRRAASRLHDGVGWQHGEVPEEVLPLLEGLDALVGGEGRGLKAYHLPPGASGLGVPPDSTVILADGPSATTGDTVVILDPSQGYAIRYLAEPYLIGLDHDGRVRHWLKSDTTRVIGKILLCVQVP